MNPLKSIKARYESAINSRNSRYWEYAEYYEDGEIWDNTFLFESFGGSNFQGNPYYIYKELLKQSVAEEYTIYISAKDTESIEESLNNRGLLRSNVKIIEIHSAEYRKILSHAKYLINNVSFNTDFIKKKDQVYLNTWHGTPLKTLGRSVLGGDPFSANSPQRNFLICDYLISPNQFTESVFLDDHMVRNIMSGKSVLTGYPRNSVFFDKEYEKGIKKKYSLENKKTIFYMPTWRGNTLGADDVDQVSEIEKLAKELGDGYKVFVKFHPAMKSTTGEFKYCYNMPEDIEVYEFLNAVDILITDYSSVFFDFANTGKKIVLYQYDKEDYYKSRGVYKFVEKNIPFPTAYNYEQLLELVKRDIDVDYSDFLKTFCEYDNINSSREALDLLLNHTEAPQKRKPVDLYVIDENITDEEINKLKADLSGQNYLFAFILNRKSNGYRQIKSWNELNYLTVYVYDRLSHSERREKRFCLLFKTSKNKQKLAYFGERERRRLWGDINIGNVYTRTRISSLPTALRDIAVKKDF